MAAAAVAVGPSLAGARAPPQSVAALLVAIDRAEPLDAAKLDALLGVRLACIQDRCDRAPVALRGVTIGHLDFRQGRFGSLLILEGFAGQCLPVDWVRTYAPSGETRSSCTDGVFCPYYSVKRPWGRLSIELPQGADPPNCARSMVFDTSR